MSDSVFHAGELVLQTRHGVAERMAIGGPRAIRPALSDQQRHFFQGLPFLVLGGEDGHGRLWASIRVGRPGFMHAPQPQSLSIRAQALPGESFEIQPGIPLGLLGLDFEARRRNRVNGRVANVWDDGFELTVDQAFGNCPKYIQARRWFWREGGLDDDALHAPVVGEKLDASMRRVVRQADTFFIATSSPLARDGEAHRELGVDVSHRGGRPGFVQLTGDKELLIPDYVGNFYFNTLGNLLINPRAGLLFLDFTAGHVLQLTGEMKLLEADAFVAGGGVLPEGAQRMLTFTVYEVRWREGINPLQWGFLGYSPFLDFD